MNVRFQKTPKGEVAILPRKDYEALVAKAAMFDAMGYQVHLAGDVLTDVA